MYIYIYIIYKIYIYILIISLAFSRLPQLRHQGLAAAVLHGTPLRGVLQPGTETWRDVAARAGNRWHIGNW